MTADQKITFRPISCFSLIDEIQRRTFGDAELTLQQKEYMAEIGGEVYEIRCQNDTRAVMRIVFDPPIRSSWMPYTEGCARSVYCSHFTRLSGPIGAGIGIMRHLVKLFFDIGLQTIIFTAQTKLRKYYARIGIVPIAPDLYTDGDLYVCDIKKLLDSDFGSRKDSPIEGEIS